jgi:uncharacterized membrane protein YhaH (DUF805 family)
MQLYLSVLKKYATFQGRARRSEYWTFSLINLAISLVLSILGYLTQGGSGEVGFFGIISTLYGLAVLIPGLAVTVRRLHDVGKNGWWIFIVLVPLIGWILLLVFLITDSDPGDNQYGPNPKGIPAGGERVISRPGTSSSFTIWVKDENPEEMFLMALLVRMRNEHPEMMSQEIKDMLDNKIPYNLQYKTTRNRTEGRTYVEFIFNRK